MWVSALNTIVLVVLSKFLSKFMDAPIEALDDRVRDVETAFGVGQEDYARQLGGGGGMSDVLRRLCRGLGIDSDADVLAGMTDLEDRSTSRASDLARLRMEIEDRMKADICNARLASLYKRVVRLSQICYVSVQTARLLLSVEEKLFSDGRSSGCEFDQFCELMKPYQADDADYEKLNRYQKLLLHTLRYAWKRGYRKCDGFIYERVRCADAWTGAWRRVCSIEEMVYAACRRSDDFDQWVNLTSAANNAASAAAYLRSCNEFELPALVTDRHVFAFRNGIYVTVSDEFYPHRDVPARYTDVAASKYFDVEFDVHMQGAIDWTDIATPSFQGILTYQEFDTGDNAGVDEWMYVMVGRLLYEVGEKDNWQVIPFLKGLAATGKSTILLNVCKLLFDDADVGVLSNNIEKKFGLWGFCNKKLFIAPEIRKDLELNQAEFQSLVSGDAMQVAQKHQQSETVLWKVPGILAGNEVPCWKDAAGSITRRILLFHFSKPVAAMDTSLGQKLRDEVPTLLVKCNKAYLDRLRKVGARTIWDAVPDYFKDTQRHLQACVDSLWEFLNSGELAFGADMYMPWSEFVAVYKEYCKTHGLMCLTLNKANQDSYIRTLTSRNCVKESGRVERFYPRSSRLVGDKRIDLFITGVDRHSPCSAALDNVF
jgi:phage/plasmid-associated DNA primase